MLVVCHLCISIMMMSCRPGSTYASILTDPHRRPISAPAPTSSARASTSTKPQPWAPRIVVSETSQSDALFNAEGSSFNSPQQRLQQHSQLEKYWRDVQSGESRLMRQGFSLAALGGSSAKRLAEAAHASRTNMQCASTEASKHALLARNSSLLVDSSGGTLRFLGFSGKDSPKGVTSSGRQKARSVVYIDLHGVDVKNALQFTDSLLQFCHKGDRDQYEVHLIVGMGNNSAGGIARLRPALKTYIKNRSIKAIPSPDSEVAFVV